MVRTVTVDAGKIIDPDSFHTVFDRASGFFEGYGKNGNAWIDCMTRPDEVFSDVVVAEGDLVLLNLENSTKLKEIVPKLLTDIFEMSAFVNWRRVEMCHPLILSCDA